MIKEIEKSKIFGEVNSPASKSEMQRAIAGALLADGTTEIVNPTNCEDAMSSLNIASRLGAIVNNAGDSLRITGGFNVHETTVDCGESGTAARMFTPIVSLSKKEITITGRGTLLNRPVSLIEPALRELGMEIKSRSTRIPLVVSSPIKGGETTIDGGISSQFLTGLLMTLPLAEKDSIVHVKNLKSRQYIDMTLKILQNFQVEVENRDYVEFRIPGKQKFKPCRIEIEGDWSGASFLLCAGAIAGEISVNKISTRSLQPDRAILKALELAGAEILQEENRVTVKKGDLRGFSFDATDCPDLFPPLAALALHCKGKTIIKGTERLVHKESNRALTIKSELEKLGGKISLTDDTMIIEHSHLKGATIEPREDHRIAMSCTIAALDSRGKTNIINGECVNKSYTSFFEDMKNVGAEIR